MGRTIPSYRMIVNRERSRWNALRKTLPSHLQRALDHLFDYAFLYASAGGYAARPDPMEAIIMSIIVGQHKALKEIDEFLEKLPTTE